jgi:hypothetical protein
MTVAALEAVELDRLLAQNLAPERLAWTFFQRIAKFIDTPWQLAVGEDFRFPQTTGPKPPGIDLINRALLDWGMIYRSSDIFIDQLSRMIEYGIGSSLNFK